MKFKEANVSGLNFEPWAPTDIRNFSVVEITNTNLYDATGAAPNGLRDPKMGITSRKGECETCKQNWFRCPGHFGHLELATPLYHAGWVNRMVKTIKQYCLHCFKKSGKKKCESCGNVNKSIQKHPIWFLAINREPVLPYKALELLKQLGENTYSIIETLPIPPNCVRPSPTMGGDEIRGEDDLTRTLLRIVRMNNTIRKHLTSQSPKDIKNVLKRLQEVITGYVYRARNSSRIKINSKITCIGDRLRHKHGRLRGNLMGKRCNFTARGVITGDSRMGMHEVGIPEYVAETLTITETIHRFNVDKWNKEMNSSNTIIKFVVRNDGKRLDVRFNKPKLQIGWKVERKLQNGDIGLFNRQPSLHKMSIMAHYVRIMPGKTFRLNLSCTTPYNADFDGDEMNFHALQTIEARAEAENLMAVKHNIVTPQSHRPVMTLVMDSFLGTFELSRLDTFLDTDEMMQWGMEIGCYDLPTPAIVKPKRWTGKQALGMLMPKQLRYRIPKAMDMESINDVVIWDGVVLYGQFAKKTLGRSQGSLIHVMYNDFGPDTCLSFINRLQLGIHRWFSTQGFSIGIEDCVCNMKTQESIEKEYQRTLLEASKLEKESDINHRLNRARDSMGRAALATIHRKNRLLRMILSGVKGSVMNVLQIMAMVGQQNSGGKRMKASIGDKTLPCFAPNDPSPEALGMVRSPYMKGMNPSEFFFSAIVGRDGLIDTAINTAVTGYIQRRLVKALESSKTEWDGSVRDANGSIIQFKYGEDGFDGSKLEMNEVTIGDLSYYEWGNDVEMSWLKEAKTILKSTTATCFNVYRQAMRYYNTKPYAGLKDVFEITKEPLQRLYKKNRLVWAFVLQTMAARKAVSLKLSCKSVSRLMSYFENRYDYCKIPHGEMVGTLAAQSLGEPVTQMTLNTFHHSGNSAKNVTLGVPRFEELINASRQCRTPSCSIIIGDYGPAEIDKALEISFSIVYVVVRMLTSETCVECISLNEEHPLYCMLPDSPIRKIEEKQWSVRLEIDSEKLALFQIEFSTLIGVLQKKFKKLLNVVYTENPLGVSIVHIGHYGKKNQQRFAKILRNKILNTKVQGVENISGAVPCIQDGKLTIETDGTNISELNKLIIEYPCVRLVKSNDPFDVLETFGIEAARKTLYDEIHMVLSFDGSYVNARHYQVLVDWMTHKGYITATTRHGINKYSETSPIARATFEQPVEVCLEAAADKKSDPLTGISEQLLMGISPKIGTEVFTVKKTKEYEKIMLEEDNDSDEDDAWISFDSVYSNPFESKKKQPPMLRPTMPLKSSTPMWSRPSMPHQTNWDNNPFQPQWNRPPPSVFLPRPQVFVPPPAYSPTSPVSPAYSPMSPVYSPTSPAYSPPGSPMSPAYSPTSPAYSPPGSPMSPAYSPTGSPMSPAYSPTSPAYSPTPVSPAYSPTGLTKLV